MVHFLKGTNRNGAAEANVRMGGQSGRGQKQDRNGTIGKERLRRTVLGRRNALSPEEHAAGSRRVSERIIAWLERTWKTPLGPEQAEEPAAEHVPVLAAFMPHGSEIDIRPVMEWAWRQGFTVLLPKSGPQGAMTFHRVDGYGQLAPGRFGLLEPGPQVPAWPPRAEGGRIDVMLVPGIAFDRSGGRLGHGRGYYDRYLANHGRHGPLPALVAPAFSVQMVDKVPVEEHDAAVDFVATETGWIATGARGGRLPGGVVPDGDMPDGRARRHHS